MNKTTPEKDLISQAMTVLANRSNKAQKKKYGKKYKLEMSRRAKCKKVKN